MSGHRQWSDIRRKGDPQHQAQVDALKDAMIAISRLYELRQQRGVTQEQLAAALDVSQGNISRTERRTDLYLSTVAQYVAALGGRLRLMAEFPDQQIALDLPGVTTVAESSLAPNAALERNPALAEAPGIPT